VNPKPSARRQVGLNLMWLVPGVVGGSEEYTTRLLGAIAADELDDLDDLELVLFVNSSFPAVYPDLVDTFPTQIAPVSGRSKGLRVGAETTWLAARSAQMGMDLMHHMGGILPAWRPSPCVLTIHDLQPLVLPEHFAAPKRIFNGLAIPRSVHAASLIVTLTEFTRQDLVDRLGVRPDRVIVVAPGFARPDPHPERTDGRVVRAVYGLGDRPFFLFPAITYPHKNHLLLLDAFVRLHREHPEALLVLTSGEAQMDGAITDAVDLLGLTGHVRRLGRIPERDLIALYTEAVALTFPSRYEGFGLPVLEAMSDGCPVLAADATALPEAVGGAGVLLPPDDAVAWADAMVRVLTDPAFAASLTSAGLDRIESFDWSRSARTQIDVYRRAISDRSGRTRPEPPT
jgi:glycosyltransferase involved in cell wall biosynthesis